MRNLRGVVEVFPLGADTRKQLKDIERGVKATLDIEVRNTGLDECLGREDVVGIIKDKTFRPPPEPTVLLMGDNGVVLGEEILTGQREKFEGKSDLLFLSDDFVVYTNRKGAKHEYFLMPPISFPEIEKIRGVKNVVSCSPTALGDVLVRTSHDLEDNPRLASVLIGFDVEGKKKDR
ncbi:MAG: hypothetical protein LUQ27_00170 [Methanomassiliicoccales archaeon]|nr:hypothetical protein [Methanomassiliicoccales archaeon]